MSFSSSHYEKMSPSLPSPVLGVPNFLRSGIIPFMNELLPAQINTIKGWERVCVSLREALQGPGGYGRMNTDETKKTWAYWFKNLTLSSDDPKPRGWHTWVVGRENTWDCLAHSPHDFFLLIFIDLFIILLSGYESLAWCRYVHYMSVCWIPWNSMDGCEQSMILRAEPSLQSPNPCNS